MLLSSACVMTREAALPALKSFFTRYVSLTDLEWNLIQAHWHLRTFEPNEYLRHTGEVEHNLYFLVEGVHRLFFLDKNENEICVGFAYAPGVSGVPDSFMQQTPSHYSLQALTAGSMLAIAFADWNALYDLAPVLDRWGRLFLTDILVGRSKRERELMAYTAEERYTRLLHESPHVFQLVPQKHLASYLGMTPETFSRMRRRTMESRTS